ncbi:MAG: hypothetical protein FWC36_00765 [Spirochaetes bacterium]|nr:hypothetical protein [Spirochaetota bacterium]
MANVILLLSASIIALFLLVIVLKAAYAARGHRPERLLFTNTASKRASEVTLEPYVDMVSKQFTKTLDN